MERHRQRIQAVSERIADPSDDRRRALLADRTRCHRIRCRRDGGAVSRPAARFTDLRRPTSRTQAKCSLRHCAAAAVTCGRVGTDELEEAALTRKDLVGLRDRVKIVADPALGKQDADLEIVLASGQTLSTEIRDNRGTPAAPLGDDELGTKFLSLVVPVLGSARAEALLEECWRFDESTDASTLSPIRCRRPVPDARRPADQVDGPASIS
ncbi:hypothetical protein C6A87_021075 [Mycobacterium sp. ITM-2016-00317]|uniref:hypothetical protein n=1 Tax=Mycobacterium sp. ITM-2016-00317 TaxID=2099694 RepID=UPI000D496BC0|nr:hypothetical protein [Mycobacterium sp. ITM-2016-00317]WNG86331.1 hypothetical protein C6A87_021075 [Mycobacterium sp. ITM-2016-00317]